MKTLVTLAILRDLVRREAQVCGNETQRDEGGYTEGGISWRWYKSDEHRLLAHSPANGLRTRICGMSICMVGDCFALTNK